MNSVRCPDGLEVGLGRLRSLLGRPFGPFGLDNCECNPILSCEERPIGF